MTDSRSDGAAPKVRRLSDAVRRVRIAEAERSDAFADLQEAERARLSMLADELSGVFAELGAEDDFFLGQLGGGMQPRLWIDATSQVLIGRDRRTYRFVKDTRFGRVVLAESADLSTMADRVTDYIAERVIERDRIRESDLALARLRDLWSTPSAQAETGPASVPAAGSPVAPALAPASPVPRAAGGRWPGLFVALMVGFLAGMATIIAYAWFRI